MSNASSNLLAIMAASGALWDDPNPHLTRGFAKIREPEEKEFTEADVDRMEKADIKREMKRQKRIARLTHSQGK